METISAKVASALLEIGAIKLSPEKPFVWASGWNSPIYCDNRYSLSYPAVRTLVKNGLADLVKKHYPDAQAIAGVATAGIPQGALIADVLGLPFLYVRPKPKDHGMGNQIEGKSEPGLKVVVVEDLISTGGSSLKAVDALKAGGVEVLGMVAIFTYGFGLADDNFKNAGVKLHTLSNYEELLKEAEKQNKIPSSALKSLGEWRKDPANWKV